MSLLTTKKSLVFDIPVDEVSTSSGTVEIRKRLENCTTPLRSKENIADRLKTASAKKESILTSKSAVAASHNSRAALTAVQVKEDKHILSATKSFNTTSRLNSAEKNKNDIISSVVLSAAYHNERCQQLHAAKLANEDAEKSALAARTAASLLAAENARSEIISETVATVGRAVREKQEKGSLASAEKQARTLSLANTIEAKQAKAAEIHAKALAEKVSKVSASVSTTLEKGALAFAEKQARTLSLANTIEAKQAKAAEIHAKALAKKVSKVSASVSTTLEKGALATLSKEARIREIASNGQEKQAKAALTHAISLANKVAKADASIAIEKGAIATLNKVARRIEISNETGEKQARAAVAYEQQMAARVAKASTSSNPSSKNSSPVKTTTDGLHTMSTPESFAISADLEKHVEKQAKAAAAREAFLASKVAKASLSSSKKLSSSLSPKSNRKKSADEQRAELQMKQDEAEARRETLLLQRAEQCGSHNELVNARRSSLTPESKVARSSRVNPLKKLHKECDPIKAEAGHVMDLTSQLTAEEKLLIATTEDSPPPVPARSKNISFEDVIYAADDTADEDTAVLIVAPPVPPTAEEMNEMEGLLVVPPVAPTADMPDDDGTIIVEGEEDEGEDGDATDDFKGRRGRRNAIAGVEAEPGWISKLGSMFSPFSSFEGNKD